MKSLVAPTKRQNYADGGVVGAIKGMFGIKPEDPERARRLAEYQANAAREKEAAKVATAPAPAPAPAITDYAAGSALKRREAAAGLKDGGPVRGPGTGTSDDVPDNVPEGTYIMPTDSTQAIGEKTLGGLGMRGIDVNLSNGEFKLPPKQVHAIGVQALNQMKDATHTPSTTEAAKGMKPELFFEGGGVVKRKPEPGIFPNNHQDAGANIYANVGLPSSPPSAPAAGPSELYMADRAQEMGEQWKAGNYAGAVGTGLRTAVQGLGMYGIEAADKALSPVIDASQRMVGGVLGTDTPSGAVKPSIAPPVTPPAPGSAAAKSTPVGAPPAAPAASASTATLPDTGDSLPTPQPGATSTAIAPGVYQHGRGQYSDNASGMGMAAGFTGQPNAQNMAAADALAGRSQQESMNRVTARGMGSLAQSVSAPTVPNSSNDWAARNNLRNMEVSAKSITANGGRFDQSGRGDSPEVSAYKAALTNDHALQQAQPGLAAVAMRENAGIQREGMQQEGATTRTGIQEQGANARAAVSSALQRDEFGLKKEAAGFQTRAAARLENLQTRYEAEKDPAKRSELAQQLRELQAKDAPARYKVAAGGQQIDANGVAYRTPDRIFNEQTGVFSDGAGAAPAPQARAVGSVSTVNGKTAVWDGSKWVPR